MKNLLMRFTSSHKRAEGRISKLKDRIIEMIRSEKSKSEVTQLCLTLCNPMDCSLSVSSVHGILQARILEWVAISYPGDLPNPGIEPRSTALRADALPSEPPGKPLGLRNNNKKKRLKWDPSLREL